MKSLRLAMRLPSRRFASSAGGKVLVLAEHSNSQLHPSTLNAITAASQLGGSVSVLVVGDKCQDAAKAVAAVNGVSAVIVAENAMYAGQLAEPCAAFIKTLQASQKFSHIVAPTSSSGKNIVPRLGGLLGVQPISDVTAIKSPDTFVRPVYAGNAISTVQSIDEVKLMTVRPTAFAPASTGSAAAVSENKDAPQDEAIGKATFVSNMEQKSDRPELGSASVVIAGGRGMKSAENFAMLNELADKLGGAVGASRAAVDAGFAPNDLQIGQTGKVVAPDLYIAVGISGAIQHLAGMKDSKTIVAINKDGEAPIFQVADVGLVGDLFKLVPELTQKLAAARS